MQPSLSSMILLFERSKVHLTEREYERFWLYHRYLRKMSDTLDLTRLRNFESMVIKHYVDCALIPGLLTIPSPLMDIGSGAGLPGIPIKILRPEIHLILAEGRQKRVAFLKDICRLLGLEGIEIYPHKVQGKFDRPVGGVITRALETIPKTLERVLPFLPPGGKAIFMKGPHCREEIDQALSRFNDDFELESDISYRIPETPNARRLVVFSKRSEIDRKGEVAPTGSAGITISTRGEARGREKEIVSSDNSTFKTFLKLKGARGIKRYGLALISGSKQVRETLRDFPERCAGIIFSGCEEPSKEMTCREIPLYRLSQDLYRQIDLHDTGSPILLVHVPPFPLWREQAEVSGCTLCVPFQDPANVGAVIRSAAAFGVSRVVILKEAAHPYHPKSARAAGSSLLRVPLLEGPWTGEFQPSKTPLITLSPEGRPVGDYSFPPSFCLMPGLEGPGLPDTLRGGTVLSIPMQPGVESLNAALATGIVLYLWRASLKHP
jgi:16S rRNA (guanine(527)-N(7))-methyltransferase RsmG